MSEIAKQGMDVTQSAPGHARDPVGPGVIERLVVRADIILE